MPKIRKAVLPVAGLGTRFLPATKATPKELLPIIDKPVLQFLVEEAVNAGVEEIIFVINPGKNAIKNYFSPAPALEEKLKKTGKADLLREIQALPNLAKFHYVEQCEALGDGHAVLQARQLVGPEPFLVLFGDELIVGKKSAAKQLVESWEINPAPIVGLQEVATNEVANYGIVKIGEQKETVVTIESFVEKPSPEVAPSNLAIIGKYICPAEIFEILAGNPNQSGEIRLIDALTILGQKTPIFGKVLQGERYDTGNKFGWLRANIDAGLEHPETKEQLKKYLQALGYRL